MSETAYKECKLFQESTCKPEDQKECKIRCPKKFVTIRGKIQDIPPDYTIVDVAKGEKKH